jgi:hypothetical protein
MSERIDPVVAAKNGRFTAGRKGVPEAMCEDGGVFGLPGIPRFATGLPRGDFRNVGSEMVSNRHRDSDAFQDAED